MSTLAVVTDERVVDAHVTEDELSVRLMDGRTISVPLVWYPRLLNATDAQRRNWRIIGGGYGLHWEDVDEDLSTEGMLRGAPAPRRFPVKAELVQQQQGKVINERKSDEAVIPIETSDDTDEKGILDYYAEGEEAITQLTSIANTFGDETAKITSKIQQHTLNIERLSNKPGGANAHEIRKQVLLTASDMKVYSKNVETLLPNFERNIQLLEQSFSAVVSHVKPESTDDLELLVSLHTSLSGMLDSVKPARDGAITFRDSVISIRNQNITKDLNNAASRQAQALNGIIRNLEEVESFALKIIFQIDEKLKEESD